MGSAADDNFVGAANAASMSTAMSSLDDPPKRLVELPTWLLNLASTRSHRLLTDALATAGSRGYDYRVLVTLREYGPTSQASLGRRAGIDRSDVVATIDGLVARGYVTRDRDPNDLRRNVIKLTSAGASHFRRLEHLILDVQEQLLAPLAGAERDAFVDMLGRVAEA